jgi:hypothetical protein
MAWRVLFLLATLWGTGGIAAAEEDPTTALLEQRYDRESNPRKQADIALELLRRRLDQLRDAYETVEPEQQKAAVEAFLDVLERLETAVTAASNAGTSKKAETFLRRQERDLGSLKTNVSYLERPAIEKVMERAAAIRERILYSLMNPPKRN